MNIQNIIFKQLKKSFVDQYQIPIDDKYFHVIYLGNHGIDYSMQSLFKLNNYLKTINISVIDNELFMILTKDFNPKLFTISLNKSSININLTNEIISLMIKKTYGNIGIEITERKKKILVDFSSPNIAKDMHVGHLRSTIIGDSICKLYETQGHEVMRVNHIGDFGLQFGMIIQYFFENCPNYKNQELSIGDLQKFYAESKKRFDVDVDFRNASYKKVVMLQSGDKEIIEAWNFIKDISRKAYDDIYNRLNINLIEVGESFYQNQIPDLIDELSQKGILCEDDGRKIIRVPNSKVPLTVIKSDGGFTYDTTDLAAIKYRLTNLNVDEIIYVVDVGQSLHFDMLFSVAKEMGWLKEHQNVKHVGFGLVLDEKGKKFKSRDGDTVKLNLLLDEAMIQAKKALELAKQKRRSNNGKNISLSENEQDDVIKSVAYGSIKYADLSTLRTNNYKFSFDKMLLFEGNTGVYQLYEYVRIYSIMCQIDMNKVNEHVNEFTISEKEELHICKTILLFPEIIKKLSSDLMFHTLCNYMYDLTNAFGSFYCNCRCLHYDGDTLLSINYSRILICDITKSILESCFNILGINKLKKM